MNTEVHWVEIDLLRAGVPSVTDPPLRPSDYRILVSRADQRTRTRYWPVGVRQPLPVIGIPLRGKDPEVSARPRRGVPDGVRSGRIRCAVDYRKEPQPPLEGDDAKWAHESVAARSWRSRLNTPLIFPQDTVISSSPLHSDPSLSPPVRRTSSPCKRSPPGATTEPFLTGDSLPSCLFVHFFSPVA